MINLTQILSGANSSHPTLRYEENRPPIVVWNLTKSCNLNCLFCYYAAQKKSQKLASINSDLAQRIVRQIKQAKIKYLLLSGGEPLLYPKILSLVKIFTSASIRCGISTNGTLVNKKLALALKRAGLDYIGVSLDGLKATHNRLRNSTRAFSQALAGLKYAQGAGLKTGIRLTLNTYNYKNIKAIFSLAENLKVERLCFYHLVYSGRAKFANYDLSRPERRRAIKLIIELSVDWIKRKIPTQVLSVDNFSDALIILNYIRKKNPENYFQALALLKKQGGCPAGKRILSIDHQGYLHPCQFWQDYRLADLKKDNLLDILQDGRLFNGWRMKLKGRCAICNYRDICGGCRVRAHQVYKDFWQEDPACGLMKSEISDETHLLEHH